jgi:hypothetical protein
MVVVMDASGTVAGCSDAVVVQLSQLDKRPLTLRCVMYRYIDRLTQLFTKYKYIWYLATMFRPFTGSSSGLYNKLESVLHF